MRCIALYLVLIAGMLSATVARPSDEGTALDEAQLDAAEKADIAELFARCKAGGGYSVPGTPEQRMSFCMTTGLGEVRSKYADLRRALSRQQAVYDAAVDAVLAEERKAKRNQALDAWRACLGAEVRRLDDGVSPAGDMAYALQNSCAPEYSAYLRAGPVAPSTSDAARQDATRQVAARLVLEYRALQRKRR